MKKWAMVEKVGTWSYENGYKVIDCTVKETRFVADANAPQELAAPQGTEYRMDRTWHSFSVMPRRWAKRELGIW